MSRKQQAIPSLTKPLTSSSVADALAECYKNAGHWGSRREILSISDRSLEKLWGGGGRIFEPQEFFFVFRFFLGGGNCLISNVLTKTNVNNVCFNSRKVTFSTAEITFVLY